MKTTYVSTHALSLANRQSVLKMQAELVDRQKELATGRLADVGLALGPRAGQTVSLRQEHARLQSIIDSNSIVTTRLDATQSALDALLEGAQNFLGYLIDGRSGSPSQTIVQERARAELAAMIGSLNATQNGEYLFAGINTDVMPIADYFANPAPASKQAVDSAFLAAFGMSQSDPAVDQIAAVDLQAFLDAGFADLFAEPAWSSDWSSASSQDIRSRISATELIATGASANQPGIRMLAMTYTMVADLGTAGLNPEAYEALIDAAIHAVGAAIEGLTTKKAEIGSAQQRVAGANERMSIQMNVISMHIGTLEGVDPYEASTRVSSLLTQIETAYALTARIQRLSLLDYL